MDDSQKLWGGRFTESPDETFAAFNNSLGFDQRLLAADVKASIAHANGLMNAGVLSSEENAAIVDGLQKVLANAARRACRRRKMFIHLSNQISSR